VNRGLLIVISGPSGVGKDTIIARLLELDSKLLYSVSFTTRAPRPGEIDGVNYSFVTKERFEQLVAEGAFLEHATYHGNLYGTLRERVEGGRAAGRDVVMKIEVNGAEQVMQREPEAMFIFIQPPSIEELVRRQLARNSESVEEMASRLKIAESELEFAKHYDKVVTNDELQRTVGELLEIIREARARQT